MNLIDTLHTARQFPFDEFFAAVDSRRVERVLGKDRLSVDDFMVLLSNPASAYLEHMAARAAAETRKHFGNVIFIFTPMYISNYCENSCPYCSFSRRQKIERRQLSIEEVRNECVRIGEKGIRHILVLTGEARTATSFDYLQQSIGVISEQFSSIGIEVFPLSEQEYGTVVRSGVDSLTLYQEVYDEAIYHRLHQGGPKADYEFRLLAPDRACRGGVRSVTIGALLGLNDIRHEMYCLALHARYLQQTYPDIEVAVSFPRIRPLVADFIPPNPVGERQLAQVITAFRLLYPYMGITLSTRESPSFRDGMLPLGITKMSAGVSTAVGGHTGAPSTTQFEIADTRSVEEIRTDLLANGFQPVMHDWNRGLVTARHNA